MRIAKLPRRGGANAQHLGKSDAGSGAVDFQKGASPEGLAVFSRGCLLFMSRQTENAGESSPACGYFLAS